MADQDPRASEHSGDDSLAAMNDHLARFFQHADSLLREWQEYGDSLRASLDGQVKELQDVVARAVRESGREAANQLAANFDAQVEQAVRASIDSLRRELDDLARKARQTGATGGLGSASASKKRPDTDEPAHAVAARDDQPKTAGPWHSGIVLLALTAANVVLAVLLVSGIRSCRGDIYEYREPAVEASIDASADADAAPAAPSATGNGNGTDSDSGELAEQRAAMCTTLAEGYDPEVGKSFIGAAAKNLCADEQTALSVTQTLMSRLPAEADPNSSGDGKDGKPDSRKSGKSSDKKSGKKKSDKKKSGKKKSDASKSKSGAGDTRKKTAG